MSEEILLNDWVEDWRERRAFFQAWAKRSEAYAWIAAFGDAVPPATIAAEVAEIRAATVGSPSSPGTT